MIYKESKEIKNKNINYSNYRNNNREYSTFTYIFMIPSVLSGVFYWIYEVILLFKIIKAATGSPWYVKSLEIICQLLRNIVFFAFLAIPIIYYEENSNGICISSYLLLSVIWAALYYVVCFMHAKAIVCDNYKENTIPYLTFFSLKKNIEIISPSNEDAHHIIKKIPLLRIKNISYLPYIWVYNFDCYDWEIDLILIVVIIYGQYSAITRIIPGIIIFWNEKELVFRDPHNLFSTSTIMRYILRGINNMFNIFDLPNGSTNISISESIFSFLVSLFIFYNIITYYMELKENIPKRLNNEIRDKEEEEEEKKEVFKYYEYI